MQIAGRPYRTLWLADDGESVAGTGMLDRPHAPEGLGSVFGEGAAVEQGEVVGRWCGGARFHAFILWDGESGCLAPGRSGARK